jgi:hypothetical protein
MARIAPLIEGQTNVFSVELARQTVSIEALAKEDDGKGEKEENGRPR